MRPARGSSRVPCYWMPAFAGMTPRLPLDARKIGNRARGLADFVEQLEAILAQFLLVGAIRDIDRDLVEEGIDMRTKHGHGAHGGFVVFARDGIRGLHHRLFDRLRERLLLLLDVERRVWWLKIMLAVFLLLDANNICRAPVTGEQALAILGVEKLGQRLNPADDREDACLPAA